MTEKLFVKFTEHNDWEGETWHFYFPFDNLEKSHDFKRFIKAIDGCGDTYSIQDELVSENDVDVLVKHSDSGYMDTHNKLKVVDTDKLIKEYHQNKLDNPDSDFDPLYKGGLKNFQIS